jgi:flavin reductase (DIM6/NTAB) family NADH-FMN oxidoreductase RutF
MMLLASGSVWVDKKQGVILETIAASSLDAVQAYKLLTGVIVPRPIAWVSSISAEGVANLAPFSYFTGVSNKPPMVGINIGQERAERKDTARNILQTEEFVVNIAQWSQLEVLHASAEHHPPHVSEIDLLGLTTEPSVHIKPPRIAGAPVQMECRLHQMIPFGTAGSEFYVGEVIAFHFHPDVIDMAKLRVDSAALEPICRLGGPFYTGLGEMVKMTPRS